MSKPEGDASLTYSCVDERVGDLAPCEKLHVISSGLPVELAGKGTLTRGDSFHGQIDR